METVRTMSMNAAMERQTTARHGRSRLCIIMQRNGAAIPGHLPITAVIQSKTNGNDSHCAARKEVRAPTAAQKKKKGSVKDGRSQKKTGGRIAAPTCGQYITSKNNTIFLSERRFPD